MNDMILTLVTFIPAVGAIVLMLMPRNNRVIRAMAPATIKPHALASSL